MKLFGGRGRSARHGASGGRHVSNARKKSAFSQLPRYARVLIILAIVLLGISTAVVCVYKTISKPPERAPEQLNNREIDTDDTDADADGWKLPTRVERQTTKDEEGNEIEVETEVPVSYREGVYNILICGTDGDGTRTDTIMIANLNANDHTVALMSIPRDTLIPANYTVPKINSAYAVGGIDALKEQLAKLLGFKVDGYVVVDLEAFVKIVDLVGGVEFDVPQDMYYNDPTQNLYINLKKGTQLLDGAHAIQMVRYRKYAAADIQRISVQQDFMRALAKKCVSIGSLTKIGEYAEIISEYVKTDLSVGNMIWFGQELLKCDFDSMKNYTPEGQGVWINGGSYYALYSSSILKIVNESFNPYQTDLTAADITVRSASSSSGSSSSSSTQKPAETEPETPVDNPEPEPGEDTPGTDDNPSEEPPNSDGDASGGEDSGNGGDTGGYVPFDPIPSGSSIPDLPEEGDSGDQWP